MMVAGGIEPSSDSLTPLFQAGVATVGVGSKPIRRELLAADASGALPWRRLSCSR